MENIVTKTNRFGANTIRNNLYMGREAMNGGNTAHTTAAHAVDNP